MLRLAMILPLILIISWNTLDRADRKLDRKLKKTGLDCQIIRTNFGEKELRYVAYKQVNANLPTLIFVHGAPGSIDAFLPYLSDTAVTNNYSVLIIDRLGYGQSDYGNFAHLNEQALCIANLVLTQPNPERVFLVGHSFGGPIAAHAAAQLGSNLGGAVLIAPAMDPANEKYFWFGKLGVWKATRWMLPKSLRVTASEKYQHVDDLNQIAAALSQIQRPILHIHGTKDNLVPFENTTYTPTVISPQWLTVSVWENANHFIPFKQRARLMTEIAAFVQENIKN